MNAIDEMRKRFKEDVDDPAFIQAWIETENKIGEIMGLLAGGDAIEVTDIDSLLVMIGLQEEAVKRQSEGSLSMEEPAFVVRILAQSALRWYLSALLPSDSEESSDYWKRFGLLAAQQAKHLDLPAVARAIDIARAENNISFFEKLGKGRSKGSIVRNSGNSKLEGFLFAHWVRPIFTSKSRQIPALVFYEQESLTEVCRWYFRNPQGITTSKIKTIRQRLKLPVTNDLKIKARFDVLKGTISIDDSRAR